MRAPLLSFALSLGLLLAASGAVVKPVIESSRAEVTTPRLPPNPTDTDTLSAVVNPGGADTTVVFSVSTSSTDLALHQQPPIVIPAGTASTTVSVKLPAQQHGVTYYYEVDATNSAGTTSIPAPLQTLSFVDDTPPVAVADSVTLPQVQTVTIDAAANDTDADADTLAVSAIAAAPAHGTALVVSGKIRYTPNATFTGQDSFQYLVSDGLGGTDTGTVQIFSPRVALLGARAVVVQDAAGKNAGYLRLNTVAGGAFTGTLELKGKHYRLLGQFDANGRYLGFARSEGGAAVAVGITAGANATDPQLSVSIGGEYLATAPLAPPSAATLASLAGRYTIQLPSPASADDSTTTKVDNSIPPGTGWIALHLNADGRGGLKGMAGDGRSFGGKVLVGGTDDAPTLSLYLTPRSSVITGTLALSSTVTGELAWTRPASRATFYPRGFDLTLAATGALYDPDAVAAGSHASFAVTGGSVHAFSRKVHFSADTERAEIADAGDDHLTLKLRRSTGVFSGGFDSLTDSDQHVHFSGVLVVGSTGSTGGGVFQGRTRAGLVTLTE